MSISTKVFGYHIDVFDHINNARYLEFMEAARWDWIEQYLDIEWFHRNNFVLAVVNININFRLPGNLGDELITDCNIAEINVKSGVLSQKVVRKSDGALLADALVTFVLVDTNTKKTRVLVDQLREKLEHQLKSLD